MDLVVPGVEVDLGRTGRSEVGHVGVASVPISEDEDGAVSHARHGLQHVVVVVECSQAFRPRRRTVGGVELPAVRRVVESEQHLRPHRGQIGDRAVAAGSTARGDVLHQAAVRRRSVRHPQLGSVHTVVGHVEDVAPRHDHVRRLRGCRSGGDVLDRHRPGRRTVGDPQFVSDGGVPGRVHDLVPHGLKTRDRDPVVGDGVQSNGSRHRAVGAPVVVTRHAVVQSEHRTAGEPMEVLGVGITVVGARVGQPTCVRRRAVGRPERPTGCDVRVHLQEVHATGVTRAVELDASPAGVHVDEQMCSGLGAVAGPHLVTLASPVLAEEQAITGGIHLVEPAVGSPGCQVENTCPTRSSVGDPQLPSGRGGEHPEEHLRSRDGEALGTAVAAVLRSGVQVSEQHRSRRSSVGHPHLLAIDAVIGGEHVLVSETNTSLRVRRDVGRVDVDQDARSRR